MRSATPPLSPADMPSTSSMIRHSCSHKVVVAKNAAARLHAVLNPAAASQKPQSPPHSVKSSHHPPCHEAVPRAIQWGARERHGQGRFNWSMRAHTYPSHMYYNHKHAPPHLLAPAVHVVRHRPVGGQLLHCIGQLAAHALDHRSVSLAAGVTSVHLAQEGLRIGACCLTAVKLAWKVVVWAGWDARQDGTRRSPLVGPSSQA